MSASFSVLPGQFYVMTYNAHLLTPTNGGGGTVDAVQTITEWASGTPITASSKFQIWHDTGQPQPTPISRFAFETASGNFLTAVDGGGRTSDVIHADAKHIGAWEGFAIEPVSWFLFSYGLRSVSGHLLSAVSLGGKSSDAIHSDATSFGDWEYFIIRKCGTLGSGWRYHLRPESAGLPLSAINGGGKTQNVFALYTAQTLPFAWTVFTVHQQPDGAYALETANGRYVTAVNGGGLKRQSGVETLHTDATHIGAWERFGIYDLGDGLYVIKTADGHYLGDVDVFSGQFSTDISTLDRAERFSLYMAQL